MTCVVRQFVDSIESAERTHLGKMSNTDHAVIELIFRFQSLFFKVEDFKKLYDVIIDQEKNRNLKANSFENICFCKVQTSFSGVT